MPKYFQHPFAENGDRTAVPDESATNEVSYEQGYTPAYELPKTNPDRRNIDRQPFNGLHFDVTENLKFWQEKGAPEIVADSGAGSPLSYSKGFVGVLAGVTYVALVDGTTTVPPSAEWQEIGAFNQRLSYVNSVADLVAGGFSVGAAVETLGYYSPGDGGGNQYEIVAGATGAADGGSFIDLANGNQAKGLFPHGVSANQFGATGDGATDNTTSTKSAHDYAVIAGHKRVELLAGSYIADASKIDDVVWVGAGQIVPSTSVGSEINYVRTATRPSFYSNNLATRDTLIPRRHFRVTAQTAGPKVVIMGDSLSTPFADSVAQTETMWGELKRQLVRANPDLNFTFVNRAIGGTTWTNANQNLFGSVPGNIDWYTIDQPWLDYIEAEEPDMLFLSFGMNDASAFVSSQFRAVLSTINSWSKVPDIIFGTNLVPSRMSANSNIADRAGQEGRDMVAGYVRSYCDERGYGYFDLNRQCNLIRDGVDVTSSYFEKVLTDSPVTLDYVGDIYECSDWGFELSLSSIPSGTFGDLDTPGTDRLRVYYGFEGGNTQTFADIGETGGNIGVMLWDAPGDTNGYSTVASLIPVPADGSNVVVKFYIKGSNLLVMVDDDVVYDGRVRRLGGVSEPKITRSNGSVSLSGDLTLYQGVYSDVFMPMMTDSEIWGDTPNQGGNDSNHPTSRGAAALHGTLLGCMDWRVPVLTEGTSNDPELDFRNAGISKSSPKGLLHIGNGSGAGATSDTPALDANNLVIDGDADIGASFLTDSGSVARIKFGDENDNGVGVLSYNHATDVMGLVVGGVNVVNLSSSRFTVIGEARFQAENNSGTTNPQNRSITWDLTSNATLTVRVRGNDGIVRTADIALT